MVAGGWPGWEKRGSVGTDMAFKIRGQSTFILTVEANMPALPFMFASTGIK
jgi:hypothetical protein